MVAKKVYSPLYLAREGGLRLYSRDFNRQEPGKLARGLTPHAFANSFFLIAWPHLQIQKRDAPVTVPVPNYPELRIGTLQSIIRQSGLARYLFEVSE